MAWYGFRFPKSLTVAERRVKALQAAAKLGRMQSLDPVAIEGALASTWWGKAWNRNLEGYADYSNRLPRGRSYARHGSVIDLRIEAGEVAALVQGSQAAPYRVEIAIASMSPAARKALVEACSGKLDSADALLGGRFPEDLEKLLTAERTGLFPHPRDIRFSCSCPDSASLCKHVAAALYGVGSRLDRDPSLFFRLRKMELEDLVSRAVRAETRKLLQKEGAGESVRLAADDAGLGALFGIDFDADVGDKRRPALPAQVPEQEVLFPQTKGGTSGPRTKGRPPGAPSGESRSAAVRKEVRSALVSLASLADDLAGCETELRALLK